MTTVPESATEVKLRKERQRFERPEPLKATVETEGQEWTLRCMNRECGWTPKDIFQSETAARLIGELHADSTGHPVKPLGMARLKLEGSIIRSKVTVR